MESNETVILKEKGRIAFIELNRPKTINALNLKMIEELLLTFKKLKDSDADIIIISGNGKGFSAGGDIKTMLEEMDKEKFYAVMDNINEMIMIIYTMPKLVISAVHGAAAGLGFSIALASDYILADEATVFAMNFIKIGLIPDGGGHYFMNKRLGEAKAKQLIWEGANKTATEALRLGLIDQVIAGEVLQKGMELAEAWLTMPIKAMLETKKIFTENSKEELKAFLEREKESQFKMRNTADHREGIEAFLEKRKPNFTGE